MTRTPEIWHAMQLYIDRLEGELVALQHDNARRLAQTNADLAIAHDLETMRAALIRIRDECFNGHAHDIALRALAETQPPARKGGTDDL